MSDKVLIWGTGSLCKRAINVYGKFSERYVNEWIEITAFIDNDPGKWGSDFMGKKIISPEEVKRLEYDYLIICSQYKEEIEKQLFGMHIPEEKVKDSLYYKFIERLERRLSESERRDSNIKEMLRAMKKDLIPRVFYFNPKDEASLERTEAFYDRKHDMWYTHFYNKRLYLKRGFPLFTDRSGRKWANSFWFEQDAASPHKYTSEIVQVEEGDVLVDVGAAEGNFSLYNIEKVKRLHLFESDPLWMEALRLTFRDYGCKVFFYNTRVSDVNDESNISLDAILSDELNFLKVDVEGDEMKVLKGAKLTIDRSKNFRCSVCAYHRQGDEGKILQFLKDNGCRVEVSNGSMLFLYDEHLLEEPEFRRGVVRGFK